ncbi:MAG TPA: dienelactone hydrolase family protein [Candidatus Acidoferrales bacterium]|jgi:carboxymethylenebutenolidase|nr:dienelactone hydrolase family protein [Candidatus Acidoferrales bacterium]
MEIKSEFVTTKVSDGTSMRLYVARPSGAAPQRGLLVMQEAFGVNAHIRDIAERFAREGFLAVAPELFHRSGTGFEGRYDDFPSAMVHLKELRDANLEADFRAAYDWLRANGVAAGSPVAAVGYCMGGRAAVLASLTLPLECAVSFYGGGIAPNPMNPGLLGRIKDLKNPVLLFWGGKDQHITLEQRRAVADALTAAGKSYVNVEFSEADHGFFCDARASYNPVAASQAWPLTLAFLNTYTASREQRATA